MKKIKKWFIRNTPTFMLNTKKYYPPIIDINLIVCSWDCRSVNLGTAKFKHICDYCDKEMKTLYHLKYEALDKSKVNKIDIYKDKPFFQGNKDDSINWINDITYDDLINGKVDCLGDIDEIDIAYCICYDGCGHKQLIVEGATQKCPNCGGNLFRIDRRTYRIVKDKY